MSSPNKIELFKPYYMLEKDRIDSFQIWPFDDKSSCSKLKMAEAGFYWTGSTHEPDTATCFVCKKTLDGWEKTDQPWIEHSKHAPQCAFVKCGRPESKITVREFLEIFRTVMKNKVLQDIEKQKNDLKSHASKELEIFTEKKNDKVKSLNVNRI